MKIIKKKSLLLVMVLSVVIIFTACKNDKQLPTSGRDKRTVIVGTSASYFPWAYQKDDKLEGYEVDVWHEIAKRNDFELEFKLAKFSGLVGMLDAGQIDTIAHQMSITDERLEKYYFTEPYAYSYYDFSVKSDSGLETLEDLKGKTVGCWLGGNGEVTIRDLNEKEGLNLDIKTYDGSPIESEVELGRLDAGWQGEIKTIATIKEGSLDLKMMGLRPFYEINSYPIVKKDENIELQEKLTKTIIEMREDGTLKELSETWFGLDTTSKPEQ